MHLVYATTDDEQLVLNLGSSGVSYDTEFGVKELESDTLALIEKKSNPKNRDHLHLSRYNNSDCVQWFSRSPNGYHYPVGKLMKIVRNYV